MISYQAIKRLDIAQDENGNTVVVLKSDNEKILLISIGETEAHSIYLALNDKNYERPLTHDLIKTILDSFKYTVEKILITKLEKNIYYSVIRLSAESGKEIFHIDSRPSDAIAIALRFKAPIFVNEELLK